MLNALLVQYQVLSDQRIHFGKLYWQSIAFLFALLLAGFALFKDEGLVPLCVGLMMSGGVTLLMGFTAGRLRQLEARYENLLANIETSLREQEDTIQIAPRSGSTGARFVITLGLYVLGTALLILGLIDCLGVVDIQGP